MPISVRGFTMQIPVSFYSRIRRQRIIIISANMYIVQETL